MDSIVVTFYRSGVHLYRKTDGKMNENKFRCDIFTFTHDHILQLKQKPQQLQYNLSMTNVINQIKLTGLSAENQMLLYHSLLLLHMCFLKQRCNITHTGTKRDKGRLRHEVGKTKKINSSSFIESCEYLQLWRPCVV